MDKLDEVKKLKKLLDDGIIDEEDFKKKKAQILGISSSKTEKVEKEVDETIEVKSIKTKTLDDYEKELLAQSEKEEEFNEKSSTKANDDFYQQEKIKARAKLDAEEEIRNKRKAETKATVDKGIDKTKKVFKWILAVALWIFGIASVCTSFESGLVYIPMGLIMILQGCMACPKITDKTQKFEAYTMHKTIIIIITVIVWVVLACAFPNNNSDETNNNTHNSNNNMQQNKN